MADKIRSGFTVRNTAPGVRGFHDAKTGFTELEPKGTATDVSFTEAEYESAKLQGLEISEGGEALDDTDDQAVVGAKAYDEITANDLRAALDEKQVPYASNADKRALYDLYTASFATGGQGGVPPITPPPGDTLDNMSDDDLRDTVKALTGADAPEGADREQLLKLARGEA